MGDVARVPVVGDTWHWRTIDKDFVIIGREKTGRGWLHGGMGPGSGHPSGGWLQDVSFANGVCKFVRSASPPKERDWSAWLPPRPLPFSGNKEFKPGCIFAGYCAGKAIVWRCVDPVPADLRSFGEVEILARSEGRLGRQRDQLATSSLYAQHAILVADVGCEPTPPEVLYGAAPPIAPPVVEALKGPHGTLECPCGGVDYLNAPHDEGCSLRRGQATRRDREQGPGLAAKFAPKPCPLVNCGHRRCIAASDQPWQPSLHPDELIGRDV